MKTQGSNITLQRSITLMGVAVIALLFVTTAWAQQESRAQERAQMMNPSEGDAEQQRDQDRDQLHTNQPETAGKPAGEASRGMNQAMMQSATSGTPGAGMPANGEAAGAGRGAQAGMQDEQMGREMAQEQVRLHAPEELQDFIQERIQQRNENQDDDVPERLALHNRAMVAAEAFQAAEPMLGPNGPRMSERAMEVNNATAGMLQREEALENRSWFRNFLFGQDHEAANVIQQGAEQNRVRIQEMNQLLENCEAECDGEVKVMLQEQMQTMLQEQERLEARAVEAMERNGILGWLFN